MHPRVHFWRASSDRCADAQRCAEIPCMPSRTRERLLQHEWQHMQACRQHHTSALVRGQMRGGAVNRNETPCRVAPAHAIGNMHEHIVKCTSARMQDACDKAHIGRGRPARGVHSATPRGQRLQQAGFAAPWSSRPSRMQSSAGGFTAAEAARHLGGAQWMHSVRIELPGCSRGVSE